MAICQEERLSSGSRIDLIKKQLNKTDLKKIIALESDEKEALKAMQISDQNYEELSNIDQQIEAEKNVKKREKILKKAVKFETKAIKNRVVGLRSYHEVYVQQYKIYKLDLKKFYKGASQEQKDSSEKLEKMAYNAFESADLGIQKAYYTINQNELFKTFTKAVQSEQLGLLYQEKMYAIFLNWDEEMISKLNQEIEASLQMQPIEQFQNEMDSMIVRDSVEIKTLLVYDTVKIQKVEEAVIYKVQIAASKKPLPIVQLRKIYPKDQLIHSEIDMGWYKYSVGYFTFYKDAQKFKMNSGVPDAFIVAYKNGKKTPIPELVQHPSYTGK